MTSHNARRHRRWWHWPMYAVLALIALVAAVVALNWTSLNGQAELGARYTARVACSCRYVEGRDMASCETDKEPGTEIVSLEDEVPSQRVFASVPFLARAAAEKRGDFGCVLLTPAELDAAD